MIWQFQSRLKKSKGGKVSSDRYDYSDTSKEGAQVLARKDSEREDKLRQNAACDSPAQARSKGSDPEEERGFPEKIKNLVRRGSGGLL